MWKRYPNIVKCVGKGIRKSIFSNYKGSSGNMEAVGAYRIFDRSVEKRDLQYREYYGDGAFL
ncbi:hypothetical protein AVEN_125616-1, partial [Araneus ventricosus]